MSYPADWLTWATGVLNGISAPVNDVNLSSLWQWSVFESGQDVMRWHNPLNTTQPGFGGQKQNSAGVNLYPTVDTGIQATVTTLQNGRYPNIIKNLQSGTPLADWRSAVGDLMTWGSHGLAASIGRGISPPPAQLFNPSGSTGGFLNTGVTNLNPLDALGLLPGAIQHFGFLIAGLLLFTLGLALLVVPELLKPAQTIAKAAAEKTPAGKVAEVAAA